MLKEVAEQSGVYSFQGQPVRWWSQRLRVYESDKHICVLHIAKKINYFLLLRFYLVLMSFSLELVLKSFLD